MAKHKSILILARRNPKEAMRVAAGMTIFGHSVKLVFMARPLTVAEKNCDEAELLELADVQTATTIPAMSDSYGYLKPDELACAINCSEMVASL